MMYDLNNQLLCKVNMFVSCRRDYFITSTNTSTNTNSDKSIKKWQSFEKDLPVECAIDWSLFSVHSLVKEMDFNNTQTKVKLSICKEIELESENSHNIDNGDISICDEILRVLKNKYGKNVFLFDYHKSHPLSID